MSLRPVSLALYDSIAGASKHGKLLWRKTAYALRGPRPHQTVGFGEDPRDRERPQRGAAGLNADFEDEGVDNDPYEFDDDLNEEE